SQPSEKSAPPPGDAAGGGGLTYPPAARGDVVDDYHGTKVADPYRWLENADSPETRAWVEAENKVTFSFLDAIPQRHAIADRLTALWNYEKYGVPDRLARRYFYTKNDGLQNQDVLYWTSSLGDKAQPRVLLDPNTLSSDGTVALAGANISDDARLMAYGLQSAGSDWAEWKVRKVDSGQDLSDDLKWIKFSNASWSHDSKGFYYGRYPEPKAGEALTDTNLNQKLYYHRVGTPQSEDTLVYERPDQPKWAFGSIVSEDGRYLVVQVSKGTGPMNLVMYQDLKKVRPGQKIEGAAKDSMTTLVGEFEAKFEFIGNKGPIFWFVTDLDAPRGRIIVVDVRKPARENWAELVPQGPDALQTASAVGGRIFAEYLHDAHTRVAVHDEKGAHLGDVKLPGLGTASGFKGRRGHKETFYVYTSYTAPATIYRYDIESGESQVLREPKVEFDKDRYETEQVFYRSKDGTKVPMFITHRKGMARDGNNPTILYGYGGFNVSLTPSFSVTYAVWMEMGGVLAIPNLRGGGEYGEEWHQAGTKLKKQNVFDDFIAAAEWLIENKVTSTKKLAIQGGSNGGLLVGACMTQRPDLFGAALPAVGVMDMLRFHKFTIGWAWVDDYGSSDDPAEFKAIYAYSPLQNIKTGVVYPPTLITTADHDDRVVPGHSFKFAARLQAAHHGPNPVLIRIQTKAGHGAGKPTKMKIAESADVLGFVVKIFGMQPEFRAVGSQPGPQTDSQPGSQPAPPPPAAH
ncbi:MAG TPA: prolyl oligopeptidase family serine peptidase, partial [Kofleriaceae bacterium]|nr:prolyl oligopeptidase family serine peptidase [Kofleriaceae bacterium]